MARILSKTDISDSDPSFAEMKSWFDENLDPERMDLADEKTYKNVYHQATRRSPGVFQLTSKGAQRLFEKGKPKSVNDIAALTSVYRPGPLAAGVDKLYVDAMTHPENIVYDHPLIKEVLESTGNCLHGDTLITTEEGEITIREMAEKQMIGVNLLSLNEETGEMEQDIVVAAIHTGVKHTIAIDIEDGRTICLTPDHQVLTTRGWIEAGHLLLTDEIMGIESQDV